MYNHSRIRWQAFVAWLEVGVSGILPETLRREFGAVGPSLALARRVAGSVGPWLLALLAACAALPATHAREEDALVRPLLGERLPEEPPRLHWLLAEELARLVRLAAAGQAPYRAGWMEGEVRCWALVMTLEWLGRLYAALERAEGAPAAQRALIALAAQTWRQVLTSSDQAA